MKLRLIKSHAKKVGLPPGTAVHIGEKHIAEVEIELYDYNREKYTTKTIDKLDELASLRDSGSNTWINVIGLHDVDKINEVMRVLTIIATIFIPLTFLAGIYGMNFEFMPELKWRFAYPAFWGTILLIFLGLFFYFKRKKWV